MSQAVELIILILEGKRWQKMSFGVENILLEITYVK